MKNWAGNLTYSTQNIFEPKTVEEVQEVVRKCSHLRTLGTRHCFNLIADSPANLLSTKNLNSIGSLDPEQMTVTVGGGIRYGELCEHLHKNGFAIHNLARCRHFRRRRGATATHGQAS